MILGQQEASNIAPLVNNLDSYESFKLLLDILHKQAYLEVKNNKGEDIQLAIGKLILIDELKELKLRVKDSLKNGPS